MLKGEAFAVNRAANSHLSNIGIFDGCEVGQVGKVEVEHDRLGSIARLRTAVGQQGQGWIGIILIGFGENVKCGLGISCLVFEAFVPGTRSKNPQRMGAGG
ncbi:MAG TPA: hypothetical protein DCY88_07235 [Cyanobacteria bacterium UBA11372]|nr:hypothetical protein [Cyanobacteria bacterium UBA11372]